MITSKLKAGDWCVLNGYGVDRSKEELMAVWEVDKTNDHYCWCVLAPYQLASGLTLKLQIYPRSWLTQYPKKRS